MCAQRFLSINDYEKELPFYLIGVGCSYEQMPKKREHGIPFYNWIQCYEGDGEVEFNGACFRIQQGQGIFIYPDAPVHYYPVSEPWMVDWISFQGNQVEPLLKLADVRCCGVFQLINPLSLQSTMRKMYAQAQGNDPFQSLHSSLLVYEFLTQLCEGLSKEKNPTMDIHYFKLQPVLERIRHIFHEDITMDMLTAIIGVSPEYLCHLFKKVCGKRPFEYITEVRINESQKLLLNHHDMRISEIAQRTGYQNTSYFCAVFKKYTGVSPGVYRQMYADPE